MNNLELDQFKNIDLVIDKANSSFIQKQFVSQGDYKGRTLTVQVTNNGVVGEVAGLTLNLQWHNKASGLTDLSAFTVIDKTNSIFRIEYPEHMMTPGEVVASIQVLQNGKSTFLKSFTMTVQQLAGEAVGIAQQAEFSALVAVLADSNKFRTDISLLDEVKIDKNGVGQVNIKNFDNETKQAMTGGSVAVVGPNAVTDTEVSDKSLTAFDKLKDIDFDDVIFSSLASEIQEIDGYYNSNGVFTVSTIYKTSTLIPVSTAIISVNSRLKLKSSFNRRITFWDKDEKFISTADGNKGVLYTVPYNAKYFRIVLAKTDDGDIVVSSYKAKKNLLNVGIQTENQNLNTFGHLPSLVSIGSFVDPFFIIDTVNKTIELNPVFIGTNLVLNLGYKALRIQIRAETFVKQPYVISSHGYFWYDTNTMKIMFTHDPNLYANYSKDYINLGIISSYIKNTHPLTTFRLSYSVDGKMYQGSIANPYFLPTQSVMYFSRSLSNNIIVDRSNGKLILPTGGRHYAFAGTDFINIANSQGETTYTFDDEYKLFEKTTYSYLYIEVTKPYGSVTTPIGKIRIIDATDLYSFIKPSNYYYFGVVTKDYSYINGKWSDIDETVEDNQPLKGKNIVTNGDSIMVSQQTRYDETFSSYMALASQRFGFNLSNYAIASSSVAVNADSPTERTPLVNRIDSMASNADLIIICIGTNDWRYQFTPFGDIGSRSDNTFYGALHNSITKLKAKYPNTRIIFMTCMKRGDYLEKNTLNLTLEDYNKAIKDVCNYHSVEVWDTYSQCMINPHIATEKTLYVPDGTHPNTAGHKHLVEPWFSSKLSTIKLP